jgi:SAM-dependent methyltransferase
MDACGCDGYAAIFDRRTAQRDLDRYRRHGPDSTTRMLLDMIPGSDVRGASILDVGAGVGAIDHELLRAGAAQATLVDGSVPYQVATRDEGRRRGQLDRMRFVAGDVTRHAADIEPADIVTLDRVICCYPDVDALVRLSAERARAMLGLVLPRNRRGLGLVLSLINAWERLRGSPYRAFAHDNARVDTLVAAAGLRKRSEAHTLVWRVVLYERAASPSLAGRPDRSG